MSTSKYADQQTSERTAPNRINFREGNCTISWSDPVSDGANTSKMAKAWLHFRKLWKTAKVVWRGRSWKIKKKDKTIARKPKKVR